MRMQSNLKSRWQAIVILCVVACGALLLRPTIDSSFSGVKKMQDVPMSHDERMLLRTKISTAAYAKALEHYRSRDGRYPFCQGVSGPREFLFDIGGNGEEQATTYPETMLYDQYYFRTDWFGPAGSNARSAMRKYFSNGRSYLMVSRGPDGAYEIDNYLLPLAGIDWLSPAQMNDMRGAIGYDPSNGIHSSGDILLPSKNLVGARTE
jgi:hypothetical protein